MWVGRWDRAEPCVNTQTLASARKIISAIEDAGQPAPVRVVAVNPRPHARPQAWVGIGCRPAPPTASLPIFIPAVAGWQNGEAI